jgi:GntR family transcriptional regulator, rspAB operon transcriptional repressor
VNSPIVMPGLLEPRRGRPTSRDFVAGELRRVIVRGELAAGEKLNPIEIADQYGVSQTPAREAIQLLASEGLVHSDAFRGARVAPLTAEEYEELYLMRIGLERLAARLGAERITDEGVKQMAHHLNGMAAAVKAADIDLFQEHDRAFHFVHYSASGRESLVRRIMNLRVSSERYARVAYVLPKVSMKDTLATHRELLRAVRRRDGKRCEEILRDDLLRTLQTFCEQFGPGEADSSPAG